MARYVMSNRRAGLFTRAEKISSRDAVAVAMAQQFAAGADVVAESTPEDPTERRVVVFDADPIEVEARRGELAPDVLLEPEILHFPLTPAPRDFLGLAARAGGGGLPSGSGVMLSAEIRGDGSPLRGAEVILFLRGRGGLEAREAHVTPASGKVTFNFASVFHPAALAALPAGGFWSMVVRGPASPVVVDAPALPQDGPLAWWHRRLGATQYRATLGRGVKIGVIDTGVGPHAALAHVKDVGAFIDGIADSAGGQDVDSHGTHVCGTIGARPTTSGGYAGIAPGATLFSARVFPAGGGGANQGDIALAIDELSRGREADLINMSLGAPSPSQIARDAIQDALERGTVCFCAAGNSSGVVEYPARFPESVAVSALGLEGWGPAGSLAASRLPLEPDRFGGEGLYLANFSCFGPEIACTAPGVGIIAPVPSRFGLVDPYASMDGTSMASPAACAALAAALSRSKPYLALPRNLTRATMAKALLADACRDVGIAAQYQGRGMVGI